MDLYQVYHDCGKPFVRTVDEEGKQHFPNHSEMSYNIFREVFAEHEHVEIVSQFIKSDMVFHSYKMEQIEEFINNNAKEFCLSLFLTSFAELYANKEMFDDSNQTSFKIKHKKLIQVSKKFKFE
jgi:hypothetical protein